MEDLLNLDFILDKDEVDLFNQENVEEEPSADEELNTKKEDKTTTEVNPDELFSEKPESVGSEKDTSQEEDTHFDESEGTSPEFFSSIAETFAEEGILPIDEEAIKNIKSAEDLKKAFEDYADSRLDEQQRRIKEALDGGIEPDAIRNYENTINYLNSITDDTIAEENEQGENLRKQIIYQDYINRGFSQARATKEVEKAISNGTDIDDAKEALSSIKEFYTSQYDNAVKEAKELREQEEKEREKHMEAFRKTILDSKNEVFEGLEIDKNTRQKVLDNLSKPVYKDPDTGAYLTAIQKYAKENNDDFTLKLGFLFTLTDGFKNLDGLIKKQTKKAVKKGFRDLEQKLKNSSVKGGSLSYSSGVSDDSPFTINGKQLAF